MLLSRPPVLAHLAGDMNDHGSRDLVDNPLYVPLQSHPLAGFLNSAQRIVVGGS